MFPPNFSHCAFRNHAIAQELVNNLPSMQEAGVCITFGRHVQIQVKIRYSKSFRSALLIGICMGPIREGGEDGSPGGVRVFGGGVSKNLLGHF